VLVELRGTNVGLLTNTFTIQVEQGGPTIPASTSVVSSIELPPHVDLGISILGPPDGVFPNDRFSYRLLASNAGPDRAMGVVVSNRLPDNVTLEGVAPAEAVHFTNGYVLFSVGTLTNQASALATVSVVATNAAVSNTITAAIRAPNVIDTNTANDTFTTNVPIRTPVPGQLVVTQLFAQQFNPQTGWMEQRVRLANVSTSSVASLRLLVEGLTNRLVNVTDTNGSTPYVAHGAALAPGDQVELILEYFRPSRTDGPDPVLTAYGTPPLDLTPVEGTDIPVDRIVQVGTPTLNNGRILLEWTAESGATYQVIHDGTVGFEQAKGSRPLMTVPIGANRVQWLDYGPPRTLTAPTKADERFYRVIELK
jgi:uncharacterized repeat protein (TIGR01451 family)